MITLVNLNNKDSTLYEREFVLPIKKLITQETNVVHYTELTKEIIEQSEKIIICGTALKENDYLEKDFSWIKKHTKPILGICAGAQLIAKEFGGEIIEHQEVGLLELKEIKEKELTKGLKSEVYGLHNLAFTVPQDFEILASTDIPQIIKKHNIYGVLFHPEVRSHTLITNFINLDS